MTYMEIINVLIALNVFQAAANVFTIAALVAVFMYPHKVEQFQHFVPKLIKTMKGV